MHKNRNEAKGMFANYLVTMTLTGAQTETLLEQQITPLGTDRGRLLQVSDGFTYACDFTKVDRATRKGAETQPTAPPRERAAPRSAVARHRYRHASCCAMGRCTYRHASCCAAYHCDATARPTRSPPSCANEPAARASGLSAWAIKCAP